MKASERIIFIFELAFLICLGLSLICFSEDVAQTNLSLANIFKTSYALAGDTAGVKQTQEAIYLAKGNIQKALSNLREILIEKKRPLWSFSKRDSINIIVFRGILPKQGKIEITKLVLKGNVYEVYAKYIDFAELDIPSEPAVIVPLGKLPAGKYVVALYVDEQLRKEAKFKIRKWAFD